MSILDFVHLGSSLALRSCTYLGSALSVYGDENRKKGGIFGAPLSVLPAAAAYHDWS